MKIKLEKIKKSEKEILENLFQLYLHDITKYLHMEVNSKGLFEYEYIDYYWINPRYEPYFIKVDNNLAGFVLIDDEFMVLKDDNTSYDLSEIFILNYYQRKGIGKKVAKEIFDTHRGKWEVRPVPKNNNALNFWLNVISEYTNNNYVITDIKEDNRQVITFNNIK